MYCINCGNKLKEDADVCLNCGVLIDKNNYDLSNKNYNVPSRVKKEKNKNGNNATGILSIIFSSIALLEAFGCLASNISEVGRYTSFIERIMYVLDFLGLSITFTVVSFVLSFINKKKTCNKVGLALSILSLLLIITEFVVVIIY